MTIFIPCPGSQFKTLLFFRDHFQRQECEMCQWLTSAPNTRTHAFSKQRAIVKACANTTGHAHGLCFRPASSLLTTHLGSLHSLFVSDEQGLKNSCTSKAPWEPLRFALTGLQRLVEPKRQDLQCRLKSNIIYIYI